MKIFSIITLGVTLVAFIELHAEGFIKPLSAAKPDYSSYADGPTISVEGRQYSFLPQARSELSSRSVSAVRPPALTTDSAPAFAPTSNQGTGEYLASKGRYDIYLEEPGSFAALAAGQADGGAGCGFCQVLYDDESGELAFFTADISVRLQENSQEAAEQLAQDYGLSLKYYMGRIGLAVYTAPSLASALELQPRLQQDSGVSRARHSIISRIYQPN